MANSIAKTVNQKQIEENQKTFRSYIAALAPEIKKALPSVITPERFTRMVTTALSANPNIAMCTPASFIGAMLNAAQLGLEPNTPLGQAYLIPYKNKGVDEVQFQIGYKGLIDLAYRSGEVELVQSQVVYENDEFVCEFGLEPKLKHVPADSNRGKAVKYYAIFKTKSGGYGFEVMSVEDIKDHAKKYSKSYDSKYSPWANNFDEMAKKTVLKKALKYAPMKSDFVRAVVQDETIKSDISADIFDAPNELMIDTEGEILEEEPIEEGKDEAVEESKDRAENEG